MDDSGLATSWLVAVAIVVGIPVFSHLADALLTRLDPFLTMRGAQHLGAWSKKQLSQPWYALLYSPPVGPLITNCNLDNGFCGLETLYLSRKPVAEYGKASWTAMLGVFHPGPLSSTLPTQRVHIVDGTTKSPTVSLGDLLPAQSLIMHGAAACTVISRTALITLLALSNARELYYRTGSAGLRAAYAGYNGSWYVEWPIGGLAVVHFSPHDRHTVGMDVFPPSTERHVGPCMMMLSGVVYGDDFIVGFSGPVLPGDWELEWRPKGYGSSPGSRHLLNMMGDEAYEIDMLLPKVSSAGTGMRTNPEVMKIQVPSLKRADATIYIRLKEQLIIAHALDCLPWTQLAWSIHRGMKELLLAYAQPMLNKHRYLLASTLQRAVEEHPHELEMLGWSPSFVRGSMAQMTRSSILAQSGHNADHVRVVTDAASLLWNGSDAESIENKFWRSQVGHNNNNFLEVSLRPLTVRNLTKVFVLERSSDLDCQMYEELPLELLMR